MLPYGLWPTRLLCPWDSPGNKTEMGCHFLFQRIFPTQGSNPHLLCLLFGRQVLYHQHHLESQTVFSGFPGSSAGKESTRKAGDPQSIPGSGRCPGEGIGYPLQFSWASLMAQLVKNSPLGHIYHIETSYIEIKSHFSFTHLSLCTSKGHDSFLHIYPAHFSPSVSSGYLCVIFLCECNIFPLNMAISVWYLAYRKTDDFYIIL